MKRFKGNEAVPVNFPVKAKPKQGVTVFKVRRRANRDQRISKGGFESLHRHSLLVPQRFKQDLKQLGFFFLPSDATIVQKRGQL